MFDAMTILTAWPVLISMAVGFTKKLATAAGVRDKRAFVRLLPLVPEVLGMLSSLVVVHLLAVRLPWASPEDLQKMPLLMVILLHAWLGVGAGAVSSKGWKYWRQSVRGEDPRLKRDGELDLPE